MTDETIKEWVLPALIPFADLKGKDLEECIYWLFDAMGAKDLEWRTGGSGSGAADGGRDLEAKFFTPGADNEIESQSWWIECKGRTGTVEPDEVKSAVMNAQGKAGLDYLVVATNTQFSNPTRDWVKEWQAMHPRPKVKLWDHAHLERLLSRHPEVVLRLFSEALSLQGRFQAMESRFWNRLEFVTPKTLADLWKAREEIELTTMGIFAAIVNEFANGNITSRPWGAVLNAEVLHVLQGGFVNVSYLIMRCFKAGGDQKPICRALSYLILCALDFASVTDVTELVTESIYRGKGNTMPDEVKEILLMPVADQLLSEMQDVCSSDCSRISVGLHRQTLRTADKDEVDDYWLRLEPAGVPVVEDPRRYLLIERNDAPCNVGFPVDQDAGCPLFRFEPSAKNIDEFLGIIKRVAAFRKAQATEKRRSEREDPLPTKTCIMP
jgi:hypothetical protein